LLVIHFTKTDAEIFKRYFAYCQRQHRGLPLIEFRKKFNAILLHFHNVHDNCGSWCKYKGNDELIKKEGTTKYKKMDSEEYFKTKEIHEQFTTDIKLTEINHSFSSQKNESMNKHISKLAPKTMTYCRSLSLKDRVCWAVCIDSIGYEKAATKIASAMNVMLLPAMVASWETQDNHRTYRQLYTTTPQYRTKRKKKFNDKICENRRLKSIGKREGRTYETGIGADVDLLQRKTILPCNDCGRKDHRTKRSKKCNMHVAPVMKELVPSSSTNNGNDEKLMTKKNNDEILAKSLKLTNHRIDKDASITTGDDCVGSSTMSELHQTPTWYSTPLNSRTYNAHKLDTNIEDTGKRTLEDDNTNEGIYGETYSQEYSQLTTGNDYSQYSEEQSQYLPRQSLYCTFTQDSCATGTSPMKNQNETDENNN
jgi:hypothetical protein